MWDGSDDGTAAKAHDLPDLTARSRRSSTERRSSAMPFPEYRMTRILVVDDHRSQAEEFGSRASD